ILIGVGRRIVFAFVLGRVAFGRAAVIDGVGPGLGIGGVRFRPRIGTAERLRLALVARLGARGTRLLRGMLVLRAALVATLAAAPSTAASAPAAAASAFAVLAGLALTVIGALFG